MENMTDPEDIGLQDKIFALIEKHKQVKESESLQKLMQPSYSLRSLYSDVLSVKIRPRSAGKPQAEDSDSKTRVPSEKLNTEKFLSPKRGKIRAKSAQSNRDVEHKDIVNAVGGGKNYEEVGVSNRPTHTGNSIDVAKYLNSDTWWDDFGEQPTTFVAEHYRVNTNTAKNPNSEPVIETRMNTRGDPKKISVTQRAKSYKPCFDNDRQYLREAKKKEKLQKDWLSKRVLEEANIMQAKCYTAVDEANSFSKYLGIRKRYSVFIKDTKDHVQSQKFKEQLQAGRNFDAFGTIRGAGDRIGKMAIEVTGEPGEPTVLISLEKFFREHENLQIAIRKHRSVIPASQQVSEARSDQFNREGTSGMGRRRGVIPKGLEDSNDGVSKKQVNETKTNLLPRSPTAFVDYAYDTTNSQQPIQKLSRSKTEEYLRKILANTVHVTSVLEAQLTELRSRGWNATVT